MNRQELEKKIFEMVAKCYNVSEDKLSAETGIAADLGGTSIMMVGLVSEIENELNAFIPLQIAAACKTVGELIDKVEEEL